MQGVDRYKLLLIALAELLIFAAGAVLYVSGSTLFGILVIVIGSGVTSMLLVLLILNARRH
ncbi:MAG: hypothetical protein AAF660_04610 [Pseudomonadota bacterium]